MKKQNKKSTAIPMPRVKSKMNPSMKNRNKLKTETAAERKLRLMKAASQRAKKADPTFKKGLARPNKSTLSPSRLKARDAKEKADKEASRKRRATKKSLANRNK